MDILRGAVVGALDKDLRNRHRVAENNLKRKLDSLRKAEKCELRMFQASKNRFQMKFSKFQSSGECSSSKRLKNVSDKFKRDVGGEAPVVSTTQNIEELYSQQLIHELVFTNDEVDIEKLLCLHLLTTHVVRPRTHLSSAGSFLSRPPTAEQSDGPHDRKCSARGECDSAKSRKDGRAPDARGSATTTRTSARSRIVNKILPCYVLNFLPSSEARQCRRLSGSGTLPGPACSAQGDILQAKLSTERVPGDSEVESVSAFMVFVNKQLEALVDSVLKVLQVVNPVKVDDMAKLSRNPSLLVELIKKPKIQNFLSFLKGKSISSSYDSFRKVFKKVCITSCSPADSELPTKSASSGKHVVSLNITFDDSVKKLRTVLIGVRRNIYRRKAFDKDKLTVVRPEEMATLNITKPFLDKKTSLLHSSASSRSNITPSSATATTSTSGLADNSQSAKSTNLTSTREDRSLSKSQQASGSLGPTASDNSREICAAVYSKLRTQQGKNQSLDRWSNKTSARDRTIPQCASPKRVSTTGQTDRRATSSDLTSRRVTVAAGELVRRGVPEILGDDTSRSQGRVTGRSGSRLEARDVDGGGPREQSARLLPTSRLSEQSGSIIGSQVTRRAPTKPTQTKTVKFTGYDVAKLKVVITDKETDKKFEKFLQKTTIA